MLLRLSSINDFLNGFLFGFEHLIEFIILLIRPMKYG